MTYSTKEEFGVDLFNAVFTIGQILGERTKAAKSKHAYAKRAAQQQEKVLRAQLTRQMEALSDANAAEIIRRYPWVCR